MYSVHRDTLIAFTLLLENSDLKWSQSKYVSSLCRSIFSFFVCLTKLLFCVCFYKKLIGFNTSKGTQKVLALNQIATNYLSPLAISYSEWLGVSASTKNIAVLVNGTALFARNYFDLFSISTSWKIFQVIKPSGTNSGHPSFPKLTTLFPHLRYSSSF